MPCNASWHPPVHTIEEDLQSLFTYVERGETQIQRRIYEIWILLSWRLRRTKTSVCFVELTWKASRCQATKRVCWWSCHVTARWKKIHGGKPLPFLVQYCDERVSFPRRSSSKDPLAIQHYLSLWVWFPSSGSAEDQIRPDIEHDLRVALSTIIPDFETLVRSKKQAQFSH